MRNCIAFLYGQKGAGKTTELRRWLVGAPRLLVVDVTGDYAGDQLRTVTSLRDAAALMAGPRWRLRLTADLRDAAREAFRTDEEPTKLAQLAPAAAWLAWCARSCVLVVDELAYWCNPARTPGTFRLLAMYGRHRGVSLIGTSRRPAEISRHLSAMADLIVAFRTTEPADLQYLRPLFGRAAVAELPHLKPFHALAAGDPAALALIGAPPLDKRVTPVHRFSVSK